MTTYVPMLALHEIRPRVLDYLEARLAAGETLPPEAERDARVWKAQHMEMNQRAAPAA